jgi:hypothetical protein
MACTRGSRRPAEPASGETVSETSRQDSATAPAGESQPETRREITLEKQSQPAQSFAASRAQGSDLLPLHGSRILPEDFKIGSLQELLVLTRSNTAITEPVVAFLDTLRTGEIEAELLLPESRIALNRSLTHHLDQGRRISDYRLGSITLEDQNAWMNIRLFGSTGVSEGELYLSFSEGKWYISDVQIDWQALDRTYIRKEELYIPSDYGWSVRS